jgi:hypothetical protein
MVLFRCSNGPTMNFSPITTVSGSVLVQFEPGPSRAS